MVCLGFTREVITTKVCASVLSLRPVSGPGLLANTFVNNSSGVSVSGSQHSRHVQDERVVRVSVRVRSSELLLSVFCAGHFERLPYTDSSKRSVYHVRNLEVFRLKQVRTVT